MNLLVVDRVSVQLGGTRVLDEVALRADVGHIVGIVGPNGSGKTTLLRLIAGDMAPDDGSVIVGGSDVRSLPLRQLAGLRAFMEAEGPRDVLFPVRDVVTMGLGGVTTDRTAAMLTATDTAALEHRVFASLSTGEQQRVRIARTLAQQAALVLLDEPTSALDIGHQEMVMEALRVSADDGATVVAAIHDLNLAAAHADQLVLLDGGRVATSGTPDDVLEAELLSAVYRQSVDVVRHPHRDCPLVLTRIRT